MSTGRGAPRGSSAEDRVPPTAEVSEYTSVFWNDQSRPPEWSAGQRRRLRLSRAAGEHVRRAGELLYVACSRIARIAPRRSPCGTADGLWRMP